MCALHIRLSGFSLSSGADPGFFLGGGALVSCSTSTPVNYIVFFFLQNTSCIRKPQVISGGGGDAHSLHPPPRSAPVVQQLDHGIPVKSALFKLRSTNGSEEFSEFPRMAVNQTINVKSCQSVQEVRPSNLLHE